MTQPFGLLSNLERDAKNPKTKFQMYEIKMGFEKAHVSIPFAVCEAFELAINEARPKSKISLGELVRKYDGNIE